MGLSLRGGASEIFLYLCHDSAQTGDKALCESCNPYNRNPGHPFQRQRGSSVASGVRTLSRNCPRAKGRRLPVQSSKSEKSQAVRLGLLEVMRGVFVLSPSSSALLSSFCNSDSNSS